MYHNMIKHLYKGAANNAYHSRHGKWYTSDNSVLQHIYIRTSLIKAVMRKACPRYLRRQISSHNIFGVSARMYPVTQLRVHSKPALSSTNSVLHIAYTNAWAAMMAFHDDVIKWKHFPRYWPFVRGIHRSRWIPCTKASDAELWCFLSDLRLNERLSKQPWGWWFETSLWSLWRYCNAKDKFGAPNG